MIPASPAPTMATVIVFGNRRSARQRRLRQLEAALFEQQRDELFVDLRAQGNRQQPPEEPGVVGGQRTVGPRPLERLDDSRHERFPCVGVGDTRPFGWVGNVGDRRPEPIDHRCVASELSQHRDEHAGVGLAQVGPQFMRINVVRRPPSFRHQSSRQSSIEALASDSETTVY